MYFHLRTLLNDARWFRYESCGKATIYQQTTPRWHRIRAYSARQSISIRMTATSVHAFDLETIATTYRIIPIQQIANRFHNTTCDWYLASCCLSLFYFYFRLFVSLFTIVLQHLSPLSQSRAHKYVFSIKSQAIRTDICWYRKIGTQRNQNSAENSFQRKIFQVL